MLLMILSMPTYNYGVINAIIDALSGRDRGKSHKHEMLAAMAQVSYRSMCVSEI